MAILGDIRKRTGLTIVVVGFALVAFIAIDAMGQNRCAPDPNNIGSVNGVKISDAEYSIAKNSIGSQFGGRAPQTQIDYQAWESIIQKKIFEEKAEEINLVVSDDLFWEAIAPQIGAQSSAEAKQFVGQQKALAESGDRNAQRFMQQWVQNETNYKSFLLRQEYLKLVNAANQATKVETKFLATANSDQADIDYAFVSYDDLRQKFPVEITDEEIEAYVAKFPKRFKREAERELHYVKFSGAPSQKDDAAVLNEINALLGAALVDSAATTSGESFRNNANDSIFILENSEADFDSRFITKNEFNQLPITQEAKDFLSNPIIGQVGGPYKDEARSNYQLVKVLKSNQVTDSIKTSHILISHNAAQRATVERTREQAQVLADSLYAQVKANPSLFNDFASNQSDDLNASQKNGDIGWSGRNNRGLDPQYLNFALGLDRNEIGLVESSFGFHIIRADDLKKKQAYQIGTIIKNIDSSKETLNKVHTESSKFAAQVNNKPLQEFVDQAKASNFDYAFSANIDRYGTTLNQGSLPADKLSDILRWAFNKDSEIGAVEQFTSANQDTYVVYLAAKSKEGLATADQARSEVLPILEQEKLTQKVQELKLTSLSAFNTQFGGETKKATVSFNNTTIPDHGTEPAVIGAAFGLKDGATSAAIQGVDGVYLVKRNRILGGTASSNEEQLSSQVENQYNMVINQSLYKSLKDNSDLKDNRDKFYQ